MQNNPKLGEIIVPGPSRNSGIRSFILTGTDSEKGSAEMIFGLLAAEAPKRVVDKLVDRLIDEIRPAFFTPGADEEARYEAALKIANRSILAFLHEHHLSLPGIKLRGVMGALSGDALFVSNRGSLKGLLIMTQKQRPVAIPLFSEGSDTSTNPKFFSSFQQGVMPPGSVFVAGTKELFTSVDETFLKRVFTERDATDAGREIRKGLSDKPNVAIVTLAMPADAPLESVAEPALAPMPRPTLITPKARRRPKGELPVNMDIGEMGAKSIEGLFVFLFRYLKLIPKALLAVFRGMMTVLGLFAHAPKAVRAALDPNRRQAMLEGAKTAPKRFARHGLTRFNSLPTRSKAHLLLLIAVSAVFVHGILYSFHKHSEALAAKAYEAKLAEIGQLQTDLETSLIIGNDRRSHDAIMKLEALIADLPEESAEEISAKDDVKTDLQAGRDKLRRYVTIADPEVLATFDDPDGLFAKAPFTWFERALYLFSPSGKTVKAFGLDGSVSEQAIAAPARIRDAVPARTGVLLAFDDGTVGFWRPGSEDVTIYSDVDFGDSPILYYQGRLYSVRADGMIERRPILDAALGAPTDVLLSPSDLTDPTSLSADGSAYLLSADGRLRKYLKGNPVDGFVPPIIDPAPKNATDLWTDVNSRWLIYLETAEDRIVMIDSSSGRLAAQLVSPGFGNVSAMTVSTDGNFAYLLSGNRILSVPLKGPGIN